MSQEYRRVFADGLVRNLVATKSHEASAPSISIVGSSTANVANDEPLFIQNAGSWADRPESMTAIGNLFLLVIGSAPTSRHHDQGANEGDHLCELLASMMSVRSGVSMINPQRRRRRA